tara:strand:- start:38 stop:685 length:648 start_codon:yes stop_codon:yes gene_type:complete
MVKLTKKQLKEIYGRDIKPSFYENMMKQGYDMWDLINNYTWIGGDGDNNRTDFSRNSNQIITCGKRRFDRHFAHAIGVEDLPKKVGKCVCGINIVENCWIAKIKRDSDGDICEVEVPLPPVIGNECITNFIPEAKKWYCGKCGVDMGRKYGYDKCAKCRCTKPLCARELCKDKKYGKSNLCKIHQKIYCWDCYVVPVYGSKNRRCKNCLDKKKLK